MTDVFRRYGCVLAVLCVCLLSLPALAAEPGSLTSGIAAQVATALAGNLATLVGLGLGVVGLFFAKSAARRQRVAKAVEIAFYAVEDLKAQCAKRGEEFPFVNKVSAALNVANQYCAANGWQELSESEHANAQAEWSAMHGRTAASLAEAALFTGKNDS